MLVGAGANVNAMNENGATPLHLSALNGCVKLSEMLVGAGANVHATDNEGKTPLDIAKGTTFLIPGRGAVIAFLQQVSTPSVSPLQAPAQSPAIVRRPRGDRQPAQQPGCGAQRQHPQASGQVAHGPPPAYGQQPPRPPPTPCSVRVALLIGNDEYTGSARLSNCVNDVHDMAQTLQRMDFTVVKVFTNVSKSRFKEAVRWLLDQIRDGCIGVFFYSGHGCEMGGDNYLVPIGADVQRPADVEDEYIKLNWILKSLNGESTTSTFCIFLDCCRDNDEDMTWKSKLKGSAASRGLTDAGLAMKSPGGAAGASMSSFAIGFASNPGTVALGNSTRRNSLYTEALLRHLPTRQDLGLLYREVAADVHEATGNQQRPWLNVALPRGYFIL
mmetsp:Transcript_23507/g.51084  ORF Transcript_23507/g.51084 Transcript_23507/m.51084 type:complete len:386 (-) Transcript_23507:45-1202(-)